MRRRLPLLALALVLSGCGAQEPRGDGRLEVYKRLSGGPVFIEGSLTRVTVRDDDGDTVFEQTEREPGAQPVLARTLPAGDYRLIARERPCQGNCDLLDPPVGGCELDIEVRPGRTTRVQIALAGAGVAECGV